MEATQPDAGRDSRPSNPALLVNRPNGRRSRNQARTWRQPPTAGADPGQAAPVPRRGRIGRGPSAATGRLVWPTVAHRAREGRTRRQAETRCSCSAFHSF
jgi:hypothetical protein